MKELRFAGTATPTSSCPWKTHGGQTKTTAKAWYGVYLQSLRLRGFRSCLDLELQFNPSVTILVGENNAGKTNIIEAIRLLTPSLNGKRERYPEEEDISRATASRTFSIEATYAALTAEQKGLLIAAVPDPCADEAVLGLRYEVPELLSRERPRVTAFCGKFPEGRLEPGFQSPVYHVYLPPLRDPQRALASGNGSRIAALLKYVLKDEADSEAFLASAGTRDSGHPVLKSLNAKIQTQLTALTQGVRPQKAQVGFAERDLLQIARDLRFRLGDHGIDPAELAESGLGYSNLLYMASVLIELESARQADLTLFLVEEPEAHLHPQLKTVLLDYLKEMAERSAGHAPDIGEPDGRIQIVVTTHSAELASGISAKHLVVLRSAASTDPEAAATQSTAGDISSGKADDAPTEAHRAAPRVATTTAVSIEALGLRPDALAKLDRYLDVTRSALLFSRRVLLVEGIAEALLLPVIAKHVVLKGDPEAYRRFRGCTLVPIDGVDFLPYLEILLKRSPSTGACIADRVVLVTDGDGDAEKQNARCQTWRTQLDAADRLVALVGVDTLEADLFSAGNESLLQTVYREIHPNSTDLWQERVAQQPRSERARAFMDLFTYQRTRKGDFAQRLAAKLVNGQSLAVPEYIVMAIKAAAAHVD